MNKSNFGSLYSCCWCRNRLRPGRLPLFTPTFRRRIRSTADGVYNAIGEAGLAIVQGAPSPRWSGSCITSVESKARTRICCDGGARRAGSLPAPSRTKGETERGQDASAEDADLVKTLAGSTRSSRLIWPNT
jgi:hypothetical protein